MGTCSVLLPTPSHRCDKRGAVGAGHTRKAGMPGTWVHVKEFHLSYLNRDLQ